MIIEFVGNKANMASQKHFNGAFTEAQMKQLAMKIIKNATHTGVSDRANAGHTPAKIIWGDINNTTFAIVIDSKDIKKNKVTIVSFYDVNEATRATKMSRFNMKAI